MPRSYIFLRDDDVTTSDPVFLELSDHLHRGRLPVVYGVIPALVSARTSAFLKGLKKADPDRLDIVQHGLSHRNWARAEEPKYEFGPRRPYLAQLRDISRGRRMMQRYFGCYLTPGFIPPYHGHDHNTLKAVETLAIPIFSAGRRVSCPGHAFFDLPARVSLNDYDDDGHPLPCGLERMLTKIKGALPPGKVTGLVYHHRAIRTELDMKAMKAFLRCLARWRDEGRLAPVLFSDILRNSQKTPKDALLRRTDDAKGT
jgi:hypothetical protein